MLVVKVDVIRPEALERRVASSFDVSGTAFEPLPATVFTARYAELGGQGDRVAAPLECFPQQNLVRERTIDVRRVPERATNGRCTFEDGEILRFRRGAVEIRHSHATQAERRDAETLGTESDLFHEQDHSDRSARARAGSSEPLA